MPGTHAFAVSAEWQGNRGSGTADYRSYGREVALRTAGTPEIAASAARPFHGDAARWNPEELLVGALAECHLLTYLYLAAQNGIRVESYTDDATGELALEGDGGRFVSVTLRPVVTISAGDPELALALHEPARQKCFIAASVNFPVLHEPRILLADDPR
ncbi:MAG: OsmC family protein [Micrococcales bacterium]|nr:OsmC family protein [Micrococcales bacterium]